MQPRWETLVAVLAVNAAACSMQQAQQTIVVVHVEPPAAPRQGAVVSLGEAPTDLSAAQISAALAGHGTWADSPTYGRVWRPDERLVSLAVGTTFIPYLTGGFWQPTDRGLYWQSSYPWGRVTFHYGRWVLDGATWWWVPGSRFAPAWVDWRRGNGWVAWSPMAPLRARSWSPFLYCPQAGLTGSGLLGRVVQGAAGSSLYARTEPVPADGDVPRGPAAEPGSATAMPLSRAWLGADPGVLSGPSALVASAEAGVDSVDPIPAALVDEAAAASVVVEAPHGGPVARITDRDLAGMSAGPSVRRNVVEPSSLPDAAYQTRSSAPALPPTSVRVAVVLPPPPLPPAPDGVAAGPWLGAYPGRAAFASRRAAPVASAGVEAPVLLTAPSAPSQASPVRSVGVMSAGGYRGGGYQPALAGGGPIGVVTR